MSLCPLLIPYRDTLNSCIGLIFGDLICHIVGKLDPPTPISKRKRAAPFPTSSANSVIGENSVQVVLFYVRDFDAVLEAFR
ncbi:hypothetical protein RHGRI_011840 [Rhododendron griersonianum]|uniref:Uncharacterized protein n=1 Tax=Rhododendron griersonianum TaxID=479676 RepID=A0AAV6KPC2_9ERIC|nr:hypothetical protein RHGRI_011840 [Rhododendron griersonianum]